MRQGIFLPVNSVLVQTLTVFAQAPFAIARINIYALVKSRTLAAIPLFGYTKTLHTRVGMGSAALSAAVALPMYSDPNFQPGTMKYINKKPEGPAFSPTPQVMGLKAAQR